LEGLLKEGLGKRSLLGSPQKPGCIEETPLRAPLEERLIG